MTTPSMYATVSNDTFNGTDDMDTVVYGGQASDYRFSWSGGSLQVTDISASSIDTSVDRLTSIETLSFADRSYSVAQVGGEVRVGSTTTTQGDKSDVIALPDGGWLISWNTEMDGNTGIYTQRYAANGYRIGSATLTNTYPTAYHNDSSLCALTDGGWLITWTDAGQDRSSEDIYTQRYNGDGIPVGDQVQVNTLINWYGRPSPDVVTLADGGWLVTWTSYGQDPGLGDIHYQRFDANGRKVGGETQVNSSLEIHDSASVTALADGGWLVTWEAGKRPDIDQFYDPDIFAQRYNAAGSKVGGEVLLNTDIDSWQRDPSVTALADGGWLVSWNTSGYGLRAQRYDTDGNKVGDETQVNTYTGGYQYDSVTTALADGGWLVTWSSYGQEGYSNAGIYTQRYAASGSKVGGETRVNLTTLGNQFNPAVSALVDGGWLITWTSTRADGTVEGTYAQRYKADGTPVFTEIEGTDIDDTLNGEGRIALAGGLGNDTYVVTSRLVRIDEQQDEGTDSVHAAVSWRLGDNLEKLILGGSASIDGTGNALDNTLTGNAAGNLLNGGAGRDTLIGGAGNDTYVVDLASDVIVETSTLATEIDSVRSAVTWKLGANLEKLTLTGSAALNGTGNALDNTLIGNTGANVLNGGGGRDMLIGGVGGDTYVVDSATDIVSELGIRASDIDTVRSSVSWSLGNNLERLILTGSAAINGNGNILDNTLSGNGAANRLTGGAGHDTLLGRAGDDTLAGGLGHDVLTGGSGKDIFRFDSAPSGRTNHDRITDFAAVDDTFQLENAVFTKLAAGSLGAGNLVSNNAPVAKDANDYLLYDRDSGKLYYDADGSGAGAAVQIATIGCNLALTRADFVIT